MITILGAGLAGLSASYHIGHDECILYDKSSFPAGHIHSEYLNGFTWDEGPHVSFTESEYVKTLFAEGVKGDFLEYPVTTTNYYRGNWIPHPAQTNLFAVPQPLRDKCLKDFLEVRKNDGSNFKPGNYDEWLVYAFGEAFTSTFPAAYTLKYWTTRTEDLTTDWVGNRMYHPAVQEVKDGYMGTLPEQTHYIKKVRYPTKGGYESFATGLLKGAKVNLNFELEFIDFEKRKINFTNGKTIYYSVLINTIPLPTIVLRSNAPKHIKQAAEQLNCTSVLLVNVMAKHKTARSENWIYVYDSDKYSTRINCTELLSPNNAPSDKTGIQVEVYFSSYRIQTESNEAIAKKVIDELIEMGLVHDGADVESFQVKLIPWANVIFDHKRRANQEIILQWLSQYGLVREVDDLEPMTTWATKQETLDRLGNIILAGRYAQWKYFWTDDCVLRGKQISKLII